MATIATARAKWEAKTAAAGERWKAAVQGKGAAYCRGIAQFLGVGTCAPGVQARWEQGVGRVTAADFQSAIAGKGSKWEENLRRALGG